MQLININLLQYTFFKINKVMTRICCINYCFDFKNFLEYFQIKIKMKSFLSGFKRKNIYFTLKLQNIFYIVFSAE